MGATALGTSSWPHDVRLILGWSDDGASALYASGGPLERVESGRLVRDAEILAGPLDGSAPMVLATIADLVAAGRAWPGVHRGAARHGR